MIERTRVRIFMTLLAGTVIAQAPPALALASQAAGSKAHHVGKSFLFDYGEMVIRVRYLSESRLEWEQIKGPQADLKAEEEYAYSPVRPDVVFFWWQEKDSSVVTQVVDFKRAVVYTTWTSPDKKLNAFQGKVRPFKP